MKAEEIAMIKMTDKNRLGDEELERVSGGALVRNGKEEIQYGSKECSQCQSSDTEVHLLNGKVTYVKCFECGSEESF